MSRGRRYDSDRKLNKKKVFAVIMAFLVLIMFIVVISKLLKNDTKEKSFILAYYTIYEDGKWGVIDTKSNVIIEPTYDEMIVIPDSSKQVFITMTDVNYENGTYISKAIGKNGKQIYTTYDQVEALTNYDESNNLWYENSVLRVQKDGKYGLINIDGRELLNCEYDEIASLTGTQGVYLTVKDSKKGLVDSAGKVIIKNEYDQIESITKKYENGFIVKNTQGKYGIIAYGTTTVLDAKYDSIKNIYSSNMYVVKENSKWKVINKNGDIILDEGFDDIEGIDSENITVKVQNKYGVVSKEKEQLIPAEYDELKYAFSNYYIAKKQGNYGIIDTNNQTKVEFKYSNIIYRELENFIEAQISNTESELINRDFEVKVRGIVSEVNTNKKYIKIRSGEDYKYYNFQLEEKTNTEILTGNTLFLSKKDGKYGYVNNKGIVVVNYIYDDATEQNKYGYVSVKKDGKWGSLDQNGKEIAKTEYALENNLVVDFIGLWHLAEDINANYYTK